ncbi:glycosyltransferase family 25 protein [Rhizobium sp. BK176]|uniref:glycosyltransferase family 25 protein n=1 Tax=Rhizobium sp. BK176 TaxID=2587071 RepID=UPI00216A2F93|nr:glycosyltransferase family 25 protein [Rhizobium sp. BK176]MCS4093569.1 glycosyl transferase family 25 [Rhizobium sp. BK176]
MNYLPEHDNLIALQALPQLRTFLINLDRAPDRGRRMTFLIKTFGLNFERISAVDGADLRLPISDFDERGYLFRHGRRPNPYEIGCYLSHVDCARRLIASPDEHALILEDDLNFDPNFMAVLKEVLANRDQWDIVRLSTVNKGRKFRFRRLTSQHSMAISLTREKGAGAYLVNRRAAAWIVDRLMPMRLPYDLAFDMEHLVGLRAFFVDPPPARQDAEPKSQIQERLSRYKLGWRKPPTVMPYRAGVEIARFVIRALRLFRCKVIA